ncbi:MAG: hypothetical protein KBS70_07375 [Bacteroidales bacterium]|nr:hypothetical protein [Candidatus Colicola equi]
MSQKRFKNINGCRGLRQQAKAVYYVDLFNLIANTLGIENPPEGIPERWIKELLLKNGEIAVWKGMWVEIAGNSGFFVYGEPTTLLLRSPNNETSFYVNRKDLAWLSANQQRVGVTAYLEMQVNKLVELEISLNQNIIASRSGDLIGVRDENTMLSIRQAVLQNDLGTPFIFTDRDLIDGESLTQIKLATSFEADKINQLKQEIYNETLAHYGILSANSNKRERVQVGEIEAQSDFAYDSIYTIIDTFNRDAESQGIATRLFFNGAMDDFSQNRDLEDDTPTDDNKEVAND